MTSAQSRVLYDPRISTPEPRITERERMYVQDLGKTAATKGLWNEKDFPPDDCNGKFMIKGVAPGSFTTKGAKQVAYLYMYCFYHPGWTWKQGLVITQKDAQGEKAVAHYVFANTYFEMYAVKDINRNGYTELAFVGGYATKGESTTFLDIAEFAPKRRMLAKFNYNLIGFDTCAAQGSRGISQESIIRVIPSATPTYTRQILSSRCGRESAPPKFGPIKSITVRPKPTGWRVAPFVIDY